MGVVEKTIKVHRSRVMRKMHATRLVDLVRAAEKMGIPNVGERSVFDSHSAD
jgi:DNA-binding NarL/FixJ family response regulator